MTRFLAKVAASGPDDCWIWVAATNACGYGIFRFFKQTWLAHRVAYVMFRDEIPEGLTLDHLCRVRNCVNPEHLDPVPLRENILRGETVAARNLSRRACPQGHPYDEVNTHYDKNGYRSCRACKTEAAKRKWAAEKANRREVA